MKIVKNKLIPPKGFAAITIFPFIFTQKDNLSLTVLTHEGIHGEQQKELLLIFFYLWYGIEFLVRLLQYRNGNKAYKNISFEREAYSMQDDFKYLNVRKHFSFLKYIYV